MKMATGFTLIEVLLSVAIIALITGMSLPILASFNDRNDLDLTTQSIVSQLRRAQTYARGINGNSQWGVYTQDGSSTLFKGSSYLDLARDTSYDEPTTISPAITVTGLSEFLFDKLDGAPNTTGSLTLTNTNTNETRTITINAKGMVSY